VPLEVDVLPYTHGGTTLDFHDIYGTDTNYCPGLDYDVGMASSDVVFTLTPPFSETYSIDLYSEFDSAVYVVTDCRDVANTCEAGVDEAFLDEYLEVDLSADVPYYIIIDGYDNNTNEAGVYSVTIDTI
jgi:hypothetical protein